MALEVSDLMSDDSGDLDGNGGVKLANSTQATKQVCIFRLKTAFDDFAPNPDIGADLESMVGRNNSRAVRSETEAKIRLAFVKDGFLGDGDIFVKIVPTSATAVVVVVLISGRPGFDIREFSVSFTLDYLIGNIQMLDQ